MEEDADLAIVVGGYNSSNTTHLVELLEQKIPAYFIRSAAGIVSDREILHFDIHQGKEILSENYLPAVSKPKIILTCGASCPDAVVEEVLARLLELFQEKKNLEDVLEKSLIIF
ncbi:4-hydroxy-3-methylbut-2-enyl diphosphate reductase [compost metagenome]